MLKKLEDMVRAVFFTSGRLPDSGRLFIKHLLQSQSQELNKLGIQSLRCIALGLQDEESARNIELFEEDLVLNALLYYVKDKQTMQRTSNVTQQNLVAAA